MKNLTRIFQTVAALLAVFAMPHIASAGTTISTFTVTPTSGSVVAGTATTNSATVHAQASGTYTGGLITLSSSVSYSGGASANPGIAVGFSPNPFGVASGSLNNDSTFTVTTAAGTTAGIYTITIAGTNTVPLGKTITYTLTVTAPGGGLIVWSPAGVDTNWSTVSNWTPGGPPAAANDVQFNDNGAVGTAGLMDNVVGADFTIGSLTYGQTNNFHTTLIAAGKALTVVNANGLSAGTDTANGDLVTVNTITGAGGALIVSNLNAYVNISQSNPFSSPSAAQAMLDMSGLDTFKANVSGLWVGVDSALKGANGSLNLARTNVITMNTGSAAPQLDVGENSQSSAVTGNGSSLLLGQTNAFFVDSIAVGRGRSLNNTMIFNSAFSSPTAYFRGTNGTASRVGTWTIGDGFNGKLAQCYATNDFSLGTVDAMVNLMNIGLGSSATGSTPTPGYGVLTVNAGTINVNTLNIGLTTAGAGTGTVNVTGGSLVVNNSLSLGAGGASASGTLNVSGVATVVSANTGITAGSGISSITMNNGTLNVINSSATIGTTVNPIGNFSMADSSLNIAIQSIGSSVAVSNLTAGGVANTINVSAVPVLTGFPTQFPIIQYGLNGGVSSGDLTTFVLGTLPAASPTPYGAYVSNNVANNSIDIVFTNGPSTPALIWDGTPNGNWNVSSTANWRPKSGPDTTYAQGDFVTFDDSLTGTANVNLTTTLTPTTLTVTNNSTNYVFSGSGSFGGSMYLVKSGSASLTLDETGGDNFNGGVIVNGGTLIFDNVNNAITGGITINGGMVQVGLNDGNGTLPSGNVANFGTLLFNSTSALTLTNPISGSGTLLQSNVNVTTLGGNSTFTGPAILAQGTLQVGSANGLGMSPSVTVSNGATFDIDGQSLFGNGNSNLVVSVSGAGVGGNGVIVNNGASQTKVLHTVTMTEDTTFGGSGDWDIRNSTGNSATSDAYLNGAFNLTKVGTNTVTFRGVNIDGSLGNINVQAGALTFTATATAPINSLGNPSATATVFPNATLTLDMAGNVPAKNFALTNGGTLRSTETNTFSSPLTLSGPANNTITVNSGAQLTINTAIGGSGGFAKNGSSTLFLEANNTYSGNTVVSGGTLALYGDGSDGSISASTNININSGATLDVSGRTDGTLTLMSGQALSGGIGGGPGLINGIFIANAGSVISPGGMGSTNIGSIFVSSNATLQGGTSLKLDPTNGTNSWIQAYGITYGGSLNVTNLSTAYTNGQTFQLFVAGNGIYNAGTFSSITLPVAPGLTWTTNLAVNGTITAVVVPVMPPTPTITHIGLIGTDLHLNGTNGALGGTFYVVASTNLTLPLANWPAISTNAFSGTGTFNVTVTNAVNPNVPQTFYSIKQTY